VTGDGPISARGLGGTVLSVVVAAGWLAVFRGSVAQAAGLFPLELPAQPWFVTQYAMLLYLIVPLTVMAAVYLFLAPGLLLVLAAGQARGLAVWVVQGFGAVLVGYPIAISALKGIRGTTDFSSVVGMTLLLCLAAAAVAALRTRRGESLPWPAGKPGAARRAAWIAGIPIAISLLLLPTIFWLDFNGDGWEALQLGASLESNLLPLAVHLEPLSGSNGMVCGAFPTHWFVTLFGPLEASARLPYALYLPVLFAALVALIEWNSPRALRASEEALLVLALAVFTVTLGFSASYNPYLADLASGTAVDTLAVVLMLGGAYFVFAGRWSWFVIFAVLGLFSRPTGPFFLILLAAGVWISVRENRNREMLQIAAGVGISALVLLAYQTMLVPWASEMGSVRVVRESAEFVASRLVFLRFDDYGRLLFLVIPCGIVPAVSLLAVRRQDPVARALAVACGLYFITFYCLAFVALHHFAPVMILPLAVFWRMVLREKRADRVALLAAAGLLISFWLSLPGHFQIDRSVRRLAAAAVYDVDEQAAREAGSDVEQLRQELIFALFTPSFEPLDPNEEFLITDGPWVYYARRGPGEVSGANYVIRSVPQGRLPGFVKIADNELGASFVRDAGRWHQDRTRTPRTDFASPIYRIPRETLFRHIGRPAGNYDVDLAKVLCRSPLRSWVGDEPCSLAGY